jgi:hypothetical protein
LKSNKNIISKLIFSASEMAHMRLAAGCCVLNLAEEASFSSLVELDQFQKIAELICVSVGGNKSITCFAGRLQRSASAIRSATAQRLGSVTFAHRVHVDICVGRADAH